MKYILYIPSFLIVGVLILIHWILSVLKNIMSWLIFFTSLLFFNDLIKEVITKYVKNENQSPVQD